MRTTTTTTTTMATKETTETMTMMLTMTTMMMMLLTTMRYLAGRDCRTRIHLRRRAPRLVVSAQNGDRRIIHTSKRDIKATKYTIKKATQTKHDFDGMAKVNAICSSGE
jgi:hypothetical protein